MEALEKLNKFLKMSDVMIAVIQDSGNVIIGTVKAKDSWAELKESIEECFRSEDPDDYKDVSVIQAIGGHVVHVVVWYKCEEEPHKATLTITRTVIF